ncbi:zinc finger protein 836-like isoform X2 [Homalodisca vitripennis]|uniref:zinc finger protein 836-like isoform X2 n=1 Tax=Homalodisca vitripennis TaxID=197043 RepID=UPI001EE9B8A7|nr:zinc finger protein 836-like isoform X2 [Homalodisca vitripennis]
MDLDVSRCVDCSPTPTIFTTTTTDDPPSCVSPEGSAEEIDLPTNANGLARMYECVLSPYELTLDIDHQPICYHSPQLIRNKKEGDAESITAILINLRSNTELYKTNNMCRFCMDTISEDCVEIFGNSDEAAELRRIYEELMPFTVNICDEFPHKICRTCIQDLKTCHTLMEKFKKAYRCLQHVAKYSLFVENDDVTDANSDPVELPCNDEGIIQPDEQKQLLTCENLIGHALKFNEGMKVEDVQQYEFVNCTPTLNHLDTKGEVNITLNQFDKGSEKSILSNQVPLPEEVKSLYKCRECSRMFNSCSILAKHIKTSHRKFKKFSCIVCSKRFNSSKLVSEHHKEEHAFFKIVCSICDGIFDTEHDLNSHHETNHRLKHIIQCNEAFYDEQNPSSHFGYKNNTTIIERITYEKGIEALYSGKIHEMNQDSSCDQEICYVCGAVLKNNVSFKKHMEKHENKTYHCDICGKTLNTLNAFWRHKRFHKPECKEKTFLCQYCPKIFMQKNTLEKHLFVHSKERQFYCEFCGVGFNHKRNFVQHMRRREELGGIRCPRQKKKKDGNSGVSKKVATKRTVPKKEDLECDVCQRKFIKVANVKRHRRYHFCPKGDPEIIDKLLNEPEIHKCDVCGMKLFSRVALQNHKSKHTGSTKPFQCEFCKKFFCNYSMLYNHERSHTGETPFLCRHCDRGFGSRLKLEVHEMEHTNEKPHECEICHKTFKARKYLTTHTRIHKDENQSYACTMCDKIFVKKESVQKHLQKKHEVFEEKQSEAKMQVVEDESGKVL